MTARIEHPQRLLVGRGEPGNEAPMKGLGFRSIVVWERQCARRKALVGLLERAGYTVSAARREPEAVRLIRSTSPKVAVLGLESVDEVALAMCRRLKAEPHTAGVTLILLARAFASASARVRGLQAGAEVCLAEPVESGELLAQVQRLEQKVAACTTGLTEANRRLGARRAYWQRLLEGIAEGVWLCDGQGRMTLANRSEVLHVGLAQFRDQPVEQILQEIEILDPDGQLRPPERSLLLRSLRGEVVRGEEIVHHRASGRTRWRQFSSAPVHDSAGAIIGPIAIVWDITEHKRTEQLLQLIQFPVEKAGEAILWLGLDARFNYVNEAACRLLGYSREELMTMRVHEVDPGSSKEAWSANCERLRREKSMTFETQLLRKDGSAVAVEVSVNYLEFGGKAYHCAFVRDMTKHKQAEEALRASREELRALAGRLQTVREQERTRVAREIHAVLAQDLTYLKMGLASFQGCLNSPLDRAGQGELRQECEAMASAANRAMKAAQKLATDLRPAILDSFGLSAAVEWLAKGFEARSGIACKVSAPEGPQPLEQDRATALFRILQESLTNVLRHAAATKVEVCLRWRPGQVILNVQDNGRGMDLAKLRDPHSFGLVGMRERALLLGGQCTVLSRLAQGTTVEVCLPLAAPAQGQTA